MTVSSSAPTTRPVLPAEPPVDRSDSLGRQAVEHRAPLMAAYALVSIAVGGAATFVGRRDAGHHVWRAAVALLAVELAFEVAAPYRRHTSASTRSRSSRWSARSRSARSSPARSSA